MTNPYPTLGVAAGATAVSWLPTLDTGLHILTSLVIIAVTLATYLRSRKK